MKTKNINIRPYTKQFYKGNRICFLIVFMEILLGAMSALMVSWLMQQLIDLIGGCDTAFDLRELIRISLLLLIGIMISKLISYHSKPKFITRGISQYKE